jgi:sugar (pentulose or hexulose) kinase
VKLNRFSFVKYFFLEKTKKKIAFEKKFTFICSSVFNFSTSAQVSFIRSQRYLAVPSSCEVRTYFGQSPSGTESHFGRELIVAPSLNGGNVLTFLVKTLENWTEELGGKVTEEEIWKKIIPLANAGNWSDFPDPTVKPTLFGERFDTALKASFGNLSLVNCDLGSVVRGVLKGVVDNVATMLPGEYLRQSSVKRIVLNGSLFKTFPQLGQHVSKVFGIPVVIKEDDKDAAYGAALATSVGVA